MTTIQWDSSRAALKTILETMRDCFVVYDEAQDVLTMKVAQYGVVMEMPVPHHWYMTRAPGGGVTITREAPVE